MDLLRKRTLHCHLLQNCDSILWGIWLLRLEGGIITHFTASLAESGLTFLVAWTAYDNSIKICMQTKRYECFNFLVRVATVRM